MIIKRPTLILEGLVLVCTKPECEYVGKTMLICDHLLALAKAGKERQFDPAIMGTQAQEGE